MVSEELQERGIPLEEEDSKDVVDKAPALM